MDRSRPFAPSTASDVEVRSSGTWDFDPGQTRHDDVLDQSVDGYYELDRAFRYRRVNVAGARLAGWSQSEMLGRRVTELFPQIAESAIDQAVARVMNGAPPEQVELYYAPLRLWGVNSVYPLHDGVAIVSRDISAQKRLEQNLSFLAEASKTLSSSLDYAATLQAVATLAVPRIADWCAVDMLASPGAIEHLALAHVDPAKIHWANELRMRQPVDPSAETGVARVLRSGRSELYPIITDDMLVAAARDEETLALIRGVGFRSVMIVPILARGAAIGAVTFVAAESGRSYTVIDLSMAEELAGRAALAIENSRLYGEARAAVALRDEFIAAASHELRTPVTSLKIVTHVLQRQADNRGDMALGGALGKMSTQVDKLAVLISDLLDVSKIEAGKLDLRDDVVDLNHLGAEVVEAIQPTAPKHRIEVSGTVTQPLRGDRDRLGQVFTNLLTNAIKFSPDADRIHIRLADGAGAVEVEVEDFGIGIDAEHLTHVFDRFYRASSPDQKTYPGLGIGLYIAREIVDRHGGALAVASAKGAGTVFRLTLPIDRTDATRDRA